MSETKDFLKYKNEREGIVTVETLVHDLNEAVKRGEVKDVVYISIDKEGFISQGCNTMDTFKSMGLCDLGKELIRKQMWIPSDDY